MDGGRGYLGSFIARVLRAMTKEVVNFKMSSTFLEKKRLVGCVRFNVPLDTF